MGAVDAFPQLQAALAGRYTIERPLGRGGWATVYLAHDHRHDRPVALKVLLPELALALGPGRFLREIAIAGRLTHPHILPLFDSGEVVVSPSAPTTDLGAEAYDSRPTTHLYYVMPYVAGETLRQRLTRERQLPLPATLGITRQIAAALAFAHDHNVVHRDIKPENILLEGDQAYVADFGIAKAIVAAGDTLSSPGLAVGTPAYMSPEQALGSANLDGRSDLYSLGCVVYEMLTGEPPHTGPTVQAVLARQQLEAPRSIRLLRPSVPEGVERAVMQALAKAPADRFSTVSDFDAALASSAGPRLVSRRSWRRGAAMAAGAALLLAGLAWLAQRSRSSQPSEALDADPTRVAVLYFDDLSDGGALRSVAGGLTEDLIDALGQVPTLHVISPNGVRPFVGRHAPPDSIGRVLRVGTLVSGSVERSADVLRVAVRLIDAQSGLQLQSRTLEYPAGDLFRLQDELAQEVSRFLRVRLGREVLLRERRKGTRSVAAWERMQDGEGARDAATALRSHGGSAAAKRALDSADSLFAQAGALDRDWADPLVLRGWVAADRLELAENGSPDSLRVWFRQGVAQADRALELRPEDPSALEVRGTLRYRYWLATGSASAQIDSAEHDLRAAAVTANRSQARAWGTLSALLQAKGQLVEANLLAGQAYQADAYLSESPQLLFRLYYTSLDLGKEQDAIRWCDVGFSRFPEDWRFTFCQLSILAWPGPVPSGNPSANVARAWKLLGQLERLTPPEERAALPRWQIKVAGVLGRAGLIDSADAVIRRARAAAPGDPEMDFYEAEARMLLGDREATLRLLARDVAANPRFKEYMRVYPVFRPLWSDPRFDALLRSPQKDSVHP